MNYQAHNDRVRKWEKRQKAISRRMVALERLSCKERRAATPEELAEYRSLEAQRAADPFPVFEENAQ